MFACSRSANEANVESRQYSKTSYTKVAKPSRPTRVARKLTYSRHCRLVPHCMRINASVESRTNRETKSRNTRRRRYTPRGNVDVTVMTSTPPLHPHLQVQQGRQSTSTKLVAQYPAAPRTGSMTNMNSPTRFISDTKMRWWPTTTLNQQMTEMG